jgi:membrane-associated phospholipid phosphatase
MVFVLVYGAEHYVSDILLGWLYATVVFVAWSRYWARRDHATVPRS